MTVTKKSNTPNGTIIQIEDWHNDYPSVFAKNDTVAAYPIAKAGSEYKWVVAGETFRCDFHFKNEQEAETAFQLLESGIKRPEDYADYTDAKHRRYLLGE